jgi:hypothetical protein
MAESNRLDRVGDPYDRAGEEWRERLAPALRSATGGLSPAWVVGGLAALAVGYLAVRHFGPDLRRYIKMEMM